MDSTIVNDASTGLNLLLAVVSSVTALVGFLAGRIHALRKRR